MDTNKRILVVDDSEEVRELGELVLAGRGWQVRTAADGAEGLAEARRWRPHLVVADVMMPRLGGIALLARLRRELAPPVPPVILCSGFELDDDEARGAARILRKPFDARELVDVVAEVLDGQSAPPERAGDDEARATAARRRARDRACTLVARIAAHDDAALARLAATARPKLQTLVTYLGATHGALALAHVGGLPIVAVSDGTMLGGCDLGAVVPDAWSVLETGSSLARPLGLTSLVAAAPLSVGGVAVGVVAVFDRATRPLDGDALAVLERFGRAGAELFAEATGRGLVGRALFEQLLDGELAAVARRGGSLAVAAVAARAPAAVAAALARAPSPTRLLAAALEGARLALFKRAADDSAGRQLAAVLDALDGDGRRGLIQLADDGVRGLRADDLIYLTTLALDRATSPAPGTR